MNEPANLPEQVGQAIAQRKLLPRGAAVLVAVSGGLDSMALLHLLAQLAPKHRWRLTVAHFNHQLRGRNSDADERFVERVARKWGLPFVAGRGDVREAARKEKLSLEMAGRKLRHAFFAREASKRNIALVALAHHADDQVELFFLRLLRGAGGEGLAGMKWQNPSPANPKIKLIRPLLQQSKSSLTAYTRQMSVTFREDATNAQLDIQRNRIRHEVIPFLRKHQPALSAVILRAMDVIGAETELVSQAAKDWQKAREYARITGEKAREATRPNMAPAFDELPVAVQRRCLQLQLARMGFPADFALIERLREVPGRQIAIASSPQHAGGKLLAVQREASGVLDVHELRKPGFAKARKTARLAGGAGGVMLGKTRIRWEKARVAAGTFRAVSRVANRETFDAAKVGSDIVLRHWLPGDRFQPIGMAKMAKLQDLFTNQKIPREQRHELVVATTAAGEIFWVEGLRIGERFKLDKNSAYGLKWAWKRVQ